MSDHIEDTPERVKARIVSSKDRAAIFYICITTDSEEWRIFHDKRMWNTYLAGATNKTYPLNWNPYLEHPSLFEISHMQIGVVIAHASGQRSRVTCKQCAQAGIFHECRENYLWTATGGCTSCAYNGKLHSCSLYKSMSLRY